MDFCCACGTADGDILLLQRVVVEDKFPAAKAETGSGATEEHRVQRQQLKVAVRVEQVGQGAWVYGVGVIEDRNG